MFRKIITAAVATAVIGTAAITAPTQAEAHGIGVGIAAGIIGGAIIGSAIASQNGYYYPAYEHCHRVWFQDDWGHTYWRRICR